MPNRVYPRKLLVEGKTEKWVIPELIEANGVTWVLGENQYIVNIRECEGISNLLKPGTIEAELKTRELSHIGIIADANGDAAARYSSLRARCVGQFPDLPEELPIAGLVQANAAGVRLGIWLFPDNRSVGMLETFLQYLAPNANDSIVQYAETTTRQAKQLGAPYQECHQTKAKIYTWLAWQDEPGRQLHQAIKERILDPSSPFASPFVNWFKTLFELQ